MRNPKYISGILSLLLFTSCNHLAGMYVDKLYDGDTIILKNDGLYERRLSVGGSVSARVASYKIQKGEIFFRDWKGEGFDSVIRVMGIDRPIFRSGGIRLVYSPDLEYGYYKRIEQ